MGALATRMNCTAPRMKLQAALMREGSSVVKMFGICQPGFGTEPQCSHCYEHYDFQCGVLPTVRGSQRLLPSDWRHSSHPDERVRVFVVACRVPKAEAANATHAFLHVEVPELSGRLPQATRVALTYRTIALTRLRQDKGQVPGAECKDRPPSLHVAGAAGRGWRHGS